MSGESVGQNGPTLNDHDVCVFIKNFTTVLTTYPNYHMHNYNVFCIINVSNQGNTLCSPCILLRFNIINQRKL